MKARYGLSARDSWCTRVAQLPPIHAGNQHGVSQAGQREQLEEALNQPDDDGLQERQW